MCGFGVVAFSSTPLDALATLTNVCDSDSLNANASSSFGISNSTGVLIGPNVSEVLPYAVKVRMARRAALSPALESAVVLLFAVAPSCVELNRVDPS